MNGNLRARPDFSAWLSNLAEEQLVLARFIELLRSEQEALVLGDADRVATLAEPKSRCIAALQAHGEERRRILAAAGRSADRHGIGSWIEQHRRTEPRLVQRWSEFLELARVADQVNRANGTLIASRLTVTQQALATLFGAAGILASYGADGNAVSLREGRQLAVA